MREAYSRERRERASLADFDAWLDASPDVPPVEGDAAPVKEHSNLDSMKPRQEGSGAGGPGPGTPAAGTHESDPSRAAGDEAAQGR